ncbi:DUF899 family protein [Leisingera sp. NJS204]|uniref:DUF899 family protein n=1 Tax=Leisingera sp. NJS204 TaxID=2508307 RepID=UPI0010108FAF|nr:DUF899 family protein [Leisingera sp. NJS204]QAX31505.1 DUF899 domain-containing protein [Leisingera sp. NJS204]
MPVSIPNESAAYRTARNELLQAELALRAQTEKVAALRRALPAGGRVAETYVFRSTSGASASLLDLFGQHSTLAVYSLMYGPDSEAACPMCAAILDGWRGQVSHVQARLGFAVVAQSSPERLAALQIAKGWQDLPLYSAAGSSYQQDYLGESSEGAQLPMLHVFTRSDGGIRHFWGSEMLFEPSPWQPRHVDALWPMWNLFDLTPEGRGDHMPSQL